ncbi:MAG: hypothetical protein ACTS6G_01095 [Candidatus Hodgkinia cicadicola]
MYLCLSTADTNERFNVRFRSIVIDWLRPPLSLIIQPIVNIIYVLLQFFENSKRCFRFTFAELSPSAIVKWTSEVHLEAVCCWDVTTHFDWKQVSGFHLRELFKLRNAPRRWALNQTETSEAVTDESRQSKLKQFVSLTCAT